MRAALFGFALLLAACGSRSDEVVVYTSVDDLYSKRIFDEFTKETGIRVLPVFDTEEAKTLGLVHRILAERAQPQCDVFWNGECSRTALLKREGVLEAYRPATAETIGPNWRDPDGTWAALSVRSRVIVYNTKSVKDPPRSMTQLLDPQWKGRVALANPMFGTTATHLAALAQTRGEAAVLDLLKGLRERGVRVVGGNSHVRDLVARGDCDVGLTDSDDVWVGKDRGDAIDCVAPGGDWGKVLFIPDSAALIKGAPHAANGRKFLDWLFRPETGDLLAQGPSRQTPVRRLSADLEFMKVDWNRLPDSRALLEKAKEALGL